MTQAQACPRCGHPLELPARDGQRAAETAVALIAGRVADLPQPVLDDVMSEVSSEDVARALAVVAAWMITHTDGGEQWLRRLGLAWAESEAS